jgi:hypothetical protein
MGKAVRVEVRSGFSVTVAESAIALFSEGLASFPSDRLKLSLGMSEGQLQWYGYRQNR